MSALGTGPFENDGGLDLCDELKEAGALEAYDILRSSLIYVRDLDQGEYLEKDEAEAAVAAAAIVAARKVGDDATLGSRGLREIVPMDLKDLAPIAAGALVRVVAANSELNELWSETRESDEWHSGVERLVDILRG